MLVRRERWSLSRAGLLILVFLAAATTSAFLLGVYPFLAVSQTVEGELVVVDGWMPTYLITDVVSEVRRHGYSKVLVARQIRSGLNPYESGEFVANYIAEKFAQDGIPPEAIEIVSFDAVQTDRTYESARAVRRWLDDNAPDVRAIDVATLGPHARRTRKLYSMAFEDQAAIGVIAIKPQDYDPGRWWASSQGVRDVPFELMAYTYVTLFFSPPDAP